MAVKQKIGLSTAKWQIAKMPFYFGGRLIPGGSVYKQWETKNFGWVAWREWLPGLPFSIGDLHLAKCALIVIERK